jgi:hypothetical protein
MPMDPVMSALDSNTNGVISAEEIAKAPSALLKLDKNSDGQLIASELTPQRPEGGGPDAGRPPFVPPILAALDADGDGILSQAEIANASAALITLDKNKDGQLTRDEFMPQRPGGRGGQGGPEGPGGTGGPGGGPPPGPEPGAGQ